MARELETARGAQRIAELRLSILRKDFENYVQGGVRSHWNDDKAGVMDFITQVDPQSRAEILSRLLARCYEEQQIHRLPALLGRYSEGPALIGAIAQSFLAASRRAPGGGNSAAVAEGGASGSEDAGVRRDTGPEGQVTAPEHAGEVAGGRGANAGSGGGGDGSAGDESSTDAATQTDSDLAAAFAGPSGGGPGQPPLGRRHSLLGGDGARIRTAPDFRRRSSLSQGGPGLQLTWRGSYIYMPTKKFAAPSAMKAPLAAAATTTHSNSEEDEDLADDAAQGIARGQVGVGGLDGEAGEGKVGRGVRFREAAEDGSANAASVRMLGKLIAHVYEEKVLAGDVSQREGRPAEDARAFLKHFFFRRYGLQSMAAKQHRVHLRRLRKMQNESLRLRSFAVVMGLADGLPYSPAVAAFFITALGRTLRPHAGIVEALAGRECLVELDKCSTVTVQLGSAKRRHALTRCARLHSRAQTPTRTPYQHTATRHPRSRARSHAHGAACLQAPAQAPIGPRAACC